MAPNTIHTCSSISPASTGSTIVMQSLWQDIAIARTMALTARSTNHKAISNATRIGGSATEPDLLHATMESKVLFSQKDNRSGTREKATNCQINAKTQKQGQKADKWYPILTILVQAILGKRRRIPAGIWKMQSQRTFVGLEPSRFWYSTVFSNHSETIIHWWTTFLMARCLWDTHFLWFLLRLDGGRAILWILMVWACTRLCHQSLAFEKNLDGGLREIWQGLDLRMRVQNGQKQEN